MTFFLFYYALVSTTRIYPKGSNSKIPQKFNKSMIPLVFKNKMITSDTKINASHKREFQI